MGHDIFVDGLCFAGRKLAALPRMKASGYNLISLTVAHDYHALKQTIHKIAKERAYFAARAVERATALSRIAI
jgi:hypothetical protein